ncbi:alpha/beta hydrolase [Afifella sp. IM 167]|uniref:alpha/beta hydrolase n=1 Tax=Afifella sp. IM 167 TaxID=2033586 RepID=UPI001CC92D32|nr:alpha/beta hydrolase [Afifella sp. IM 167]
MVDRTMLSVLTASRGFVALVALLSVLACGQMARAETSPLLASEILALATTDPAAALARVDAEIAEAAAETPPDIVRLRDLYRLKADLLHAQGRLAEAARVLLELAGSAQAGQESSGGDPIAILHEAGELLARAGDQRAAERVYRAALEEEAEAGMPVEVRRRTLARLAEIAEERGDSEAASAYRQNAAELAERQPVPTRGAGEEAEAESVDIYYATDRAPTHDPYPGRFYGHDRGKLEYGVATVTIPRNHVPGRIEAPSILSFEVTPSPARHIILVSVKPMAGDDVFARMRAHLEKSDTDDAFVFVHGYNVSFEDAAKRTAQLAYDMGFNGLPILYSWPSRASTIAYMADAAVVRFSGRRLWHFLEDVVARSGAKRIHLIAHSMGNRAMTDALELMALKRGGGDMPVFDQIIFAAPDVDAGLFAEMATTIRPLGRRLTLYASNEDWALAVSRKLHGDAPRAGQGGENILATPVVDSVDMSLLGEDMLKHGYFADDSSALVDLVSLFWQNPDPAQRCGLELRESSEQKVRVWDYQPSACDGATVLPLVARLRHAKIGTVEGVKRTVATLLHDRSLAARIEPLVERLVSKP